MKLIKLSTGLAVLGIVFLLASSNATPDMPLNYADMTTPELEEKVEELIMQKELPFEMGVELMERWSNK